MGSGKMQVVFFMAGVIHQLWQQLLNTRCLSFRWTYAELRAWIPQPFVSYSSNVMTGQHSVIFHSKCQIKYSYWLFRVVNPPLIYTLPGLLRSSLKRLTRFSRNTFIFKVRIELIDSLL
jgi:hypothetical protein